MADEEHNLILEHLRAIRAKLSDLESGQNRVLDRLVTIDTHMAGLFTSEVSHSAELRELFRRMDRVESRLELRDQP